MGKQRKSNDKVGPVAKTARHSPIRLSFPSRITSISIRFSPKIFPASSKSISISVKEAGFHEVRLIHGKGKGVQRNIIRALLEKHANVESFHDAAARSRQLGRDGGNSKS